MSLPTWERGLKHVSKIQSSRPGQVAPHVGAWIETLERTDPAQDDRSLPTWERGLKPASLLYCTAHCRSLPTWERGLKPDVKNMVILELGSLPTWKRGLKPQR